VVDHGEEREVCSEPTESRLSAYVGSDRGTFSEGTILRPVPGPKIAGEFRFTDAMACLSTATFVFILHALMALYPRC